MVIWQDCQATFPYTSRPWYAESSFWLVYSQIHQVEHVPSGPTNSSKTTTRHPLRLCGGMLLVDSVQEAGY